MDRKRQIFTPESYRKLAQNPFVDKKMLQFVKNKTRQSPLLAGSPPTASAEPQHRMEHQSSGSNVNRDKRYASGPVISEQAAKLIAAALKGLLRD
jgi:hypothetical protein